MVRLLGFFEQKDETLIVVEYVDNGSLREHLDGMYFNWSLIVLKFAFTFPISVGYICQ